MCVFVNKDRETARDKERGKKDRYRESSLYNLTQLSDACFSFNRVKLPAIYKGFDQHPWHDFVRLGLHYDRQIILLSFEKAKRLSLLF